MGELPEDVVTEATRLTRLARGASDPDEAAAYERERARRLDEYGFAARVRADGTLVCHPSEWVVDGAVDPARIDDIGRATEVTLEGGEEGATWEEVEAHNATIVSAVREAHGPVHGATARAFADFMGNHYLQRVETATGRQLAEFVDEYFPRNGWPTAEQRDAVDESLEHLFAAADATRPAFPDGREEVDAGRSAVDGDDRG